MGVVRDALMPGEKVRGLRGGGRSPPRTFLHGNSSLTGKITGNLDQPPLRKARKVQPLALFPVLLLCNDADRNREFVQPEQGIPKPEQGILAALYVSVEFSHACLAQADCDLTSTARNAEEDSSVEMAGGLSV